MEFGVTLLFAFSVWVLFFTGARRAGKPFFYSFLAALVLGVWFFLVLFLAKTPFFAINPLIAANILLGFLVLFIFLQKVYVSPSIRAVFLNIPQHLIIGVQVFRLLGINFLMLERAGILPAVFAFPSGYGDILIGITAPFVAYWYFKKKSFAKKIAVFWNYLGILDLVVALGIGTLGFPRPLQVLPLTPSTEPFALYPLALIPLFAVPLSLVLHLFSLQMLRKNPSAKRVILGDI